ncbi:unnamed protein product [Gongylonema pulchrum]|uniref:alanine--tRNA ligase n=1 Tax=Gongylonema pulchrum TaxID=637853 RepID=A0A3P6NUR5_9BILA|nr:unnamed protein product [Gongylonema pulchrum]
MRRFVCFFENPLQQQQQRGLTALEVRTSFLDFFTERGHTYVPSSSVIPEHDRSVAFGKLADLRNVVNWQKCIRVGGKHNDYDDVGRDLSHHTFFEMLGNYSFGGYSKMQACQFAWEFLTNVLRISEDRLYVSYFGGDEKLKMDEDRECRDIWIKIGVPQDRILPFGSAHNFWEMAETGPCGPCTEIHYDLIGNRNARMLVNSSDRTVVELSTIDFRDLSTKITNLPSLYVDCGMGFERLLSIIQGLRSTYDTDLFAPLIEIIHKVIHIFRSQYIFLCSKAQRYSGQVEETSESGRRDRAYRIIADHLRAACIMIADGVKPGSRNRGYHLRKVIRRAVLNLTLTLGTEREALATLVPGFVKHMAPLYNNVLASENEILDTVASEERLFWKSYDKGCKFLQRNIALHSKILPGEFFSLFR